MNRAVVIIAEAAERRAKREAAGYKPRGKKGAPKKEGETAEKAEKPAKKAPAKRKKAASEE